MFLRLLVSGFLITSLTASAQKYVPKTLISAGLFDSSMIALLPIGENASWFKSNQSFQLTPYDFVVIDSLLKVSIDSNNSRQKDTARQRWNNYIHLSQYKRQYVSFLSKGARKVFLNCFHALVIDRNNELKNGNRGSKYFMDLHQQMISADGGGRYYFSVFIDLTTKSYYEFWINAPF